MRILFLSDIHGVPLTLEAAFENAATLGYDKIVLLGDLLYHGPRNGVPDFYDPVKVAVLRLEPCESWCPAEMEVVFRSETFAGDEVRVETAAADGYTYHRVSAPDGKDHVVARTKG